MIPLTLAEVAAVVEGRVDGDPATTVTAEAFLDSRSPVPGGLFVALRGEHADGHDYAAAAVAGGAAAVLSSRPTGVPAVLVEDPAAALAALAAEVLRRLRAVPGTIRVVAITGSQGKTSVKDLLARVLADDADTVATHGSFNNELGLPLTVLRAGPGTRWLVLEMGARGIGHLRELCAVAPPDVSVVLNVGRAHLGEFGSQEAIARAKGELVEALGPGGVAVLNADDPRVRAMAGRTAGEVVLFGSAAEAAVRFESVLTDEFGRPAFDLVHAGDRARIRLRLLGAHQVGNATAAAAAALALGLELGAVAASLASIASLSRWRMELSERSDGLLVLNDSYNANPDSMAAALRTLAEIGTRSERRTVAVLGEMRELGETAAAEHEAVGRLTAELGVDQVVVVGAEAAAIAAGAEAAATPTAAGATAPRVVRVASVAQATAWLRDNVRSSEVVLVKASRAGRLERVAEELLAEGPAGEPEESQL